MDLLGGGILGAMKSKVFSMLPGDESVSKETTGILRGNETETAVQNEMMGYGKRYLSGMMRGDAVGLLKMFSEMPTAIMEWGDALAASQKELMAFNAEIAFATVESERREILRKIEKGEATGESTRDMVLALETLKDELAPLKNITTNAMNKLVTAWLRGVTIMYNIFTRMTGIEESLEWFIGETKARKSGAAFTRLFEDLEKNDPLTRGAKPRK